MVGIESELIQIDEAKFVRNRKYNKGRMLAGDSSPNECSPKNIKSNCNHSQRIDGFWVNQRRGFTLLLLLHIEKRCQDSSRNY